jgi:superfamily I DNA/RNA helicase
MASPSGIVGYLRQCYEADNRETSITSLFQTKIRHLEFFSGTEDLLRGVLDYMPLDEERAQPAQKEATLYRKEKTLVYCAFPIVGAISQPSTLPSKLCAPLLFYPATFSEEPSGIALKADLSNQRVNFPVLSALAGDSEIARSFVETLLAEIPEPPFEKGDVFKIISLLSDLAPNIEFLDLAEYPELASAKRVRDGFNGSSLRCLCAAAMALIPNSPYTRGVLYELSALAKAPQLSTPLKMLFEHDKQEVAPAAPLSETCVPAVLSAAQQRVLASALTNPLTLVIGPPGTGKSYTIAALALDQLSRGQSVLVASRMNQAVDVITEKIKGMIGPSHCVIRGGRREYLKDLKKFLELILQGITPYADGAPPRLLRKQLADVNGRIAKLERRLPRLSQLEERWGSIKTDETASGFWPEVKLRYLEWRKKTPRPLWHMMHAYEEMLTQRNALTAQLLQSLIAQRLQKMITEHRKDLTKLHNAIRSRSDMKKEKLFAEIDHQVLFGTFPVWLATLADVSTILPLQEELFDIAIIDEATQCDMASCVPVFQRARRVVIVGDPNQLRHVSFLSRARQRAAAEDQGLDEFQSQLYQYREKSILDVVNETIPSQNQVVLLDEHFRSMPEIIEFSNREFYAGALRIMTRRPETVKLKALEVCNVHGARRTKGVNNEEARALVGEVSRRVRAEEAMPASAASSLGILSPFRDQADHLFSLLEGALSIDALQKHNLLVGTAHTFQGEERDVMYLSLAVDAEAHSATFRFLNNPNVFNVAITRARNHQYVFSSFLPAQLQGDSLLRRYMDHATSATAPRIQQGQPQRDAFLREVCGELEAKEFQTWPAYTVAGMKIDLVAGRDGRSMGIDLIGHPGEFSGAFTLERYRMYHRAGLTLFPLPYSAWRQDKIGCVHAVEQWLGDIPKG